MTYTQELEKALARCESFREKARDNSQPHDITRAYAVDLATCPELGQVIAAARKYLAELT